MSHEQIANAKGLQLAYFYTKGQEDLPTILFCGGYKSDMMGTKATYLEEFAKDKGFGYARFDYSGHGYSEGAFKDGTIGSWCADALTIIDSVISGDILIIGSSMGGWISLLCAQKRPDRIKALIGIAAAPDFTTPLYETFSDVQKEELSNNGFVEVPNEYSDEPYIFTQQLFEDGKNQFVLSHDKATPIDIPVYLIHGLRDDDVPWETALTIQKHLRSEDVSIEYLKDADHRLSRDQDLDRLSDAILLLNRKI